ncbi:DUF6542 domain-containing protein, partial [Saccharopolyspora rectivirgula]
MTATRDSQSAPDPEKGANDWSAHSAFGSRGLPLGGALLLAAGLTALGTVLDVLIWSQPGLIYKGCFLVSCTLAVGLVRRRNVFGPMVQPPLVLAVVMPLVVLLTGLGDGAGLASKALAVVNPLINSFPVMAATTAIAVVIGLVRMFVTERAPAKNTTPDEETSEDAPRKRRKKSEARKKSEEAADSGKRNRRTSRSNPDEEPEPGARRPRRRQPADGERRRARPEQGGESRRNREQPPARPREETGRPREENSDRARGNAPGRPRPDVPGRPRPMG